MRYFTTLILSFISVFIYAQGTSHQVNNVKAFAKLYGYVRYFHPSDEAASIDWEKFAIYGSAEVVNAANDDSLLKKLRELFYPIAPSVMIFKNALPQSFDVKKITPSNPGDYKPIAWQHSGLGISSESVYKSVRINRPVPQITSSGNAFAPFVQTIDAIAFRGKELRFSGWMKTIFAESNEGAGQFWLRVDKEEGTGFFYNMNDKPVTASEWKEYSFNGKIDADAKQIAFGASLSGSGKILVDHIKLQVKVGNEWKDIAIKNASFENADKGIPADWIVRSIGKRAPSSGVNYTYLINKSDVYEGGASFEVSGIEENISRKGPDAKELFDLHSKPGEMVEKMLSSTIQAIIPLALYGNDNYTYPVGDSVSLGTLKSRITQFCKTANKGSDLAVRLGDVAITWNIFKHFFPYWGDASKDAETILTQGLQKSMRDKTALDFKQTLQLMTEPLNDGHILVTLIGDTSEIFQPNILIDIVENNVVIDKIADEFLAKHIQPGDVIEKIDGKDAMQEVKEKQSLISGSPQFKNYRVVRNLLLGTKNSEMILSLNRGGRRFNQTVIRRYNISVFNGVTDKDRKKSGEMKEGIYYIALDKLAADSIKKWEKKLSAAKAIICDLRGYPNGNHNLINYLIKEKEQTRWMFIPRIIYPDYTNVSSYEEGGWDMKPEQPSFKGKIIFITDGRAISYAESYMGYIKDFKLATIIGGPTAGTNGNINPFSLPGGYRLSWTGMLVKNHDGSKHHLRGIVPDVPLERTIKGIVDGRDELLEKAVELAEKR